ncbi:Crp/Fnr family transcriptional regulator [Falsiroseomonas oryziterrae]|uniref:Crp/Fnr family transcriptional regulator n=1 Tax=Falsiroseomonas oryziterrae TaxID=2911368 RepID=UPI001F3FE58C|nr:Crp/Fnr family transcriptional regulator [Roseomonas sp. NPKOSM-4]
MPDPAALPPGLDPAARDRIAALAIPLAAPAGAALFHPGDPCRGFVMLSGGRIRVDLVAEDGHALLLYRVAPGEACLLTTACLFAGETYAAEGRAETAVSGLLLPRSAFEALVAENASFRGFVLAGFGQRLATLMARIEALSFRSVDRRLAGALLARNAPDIAAAHAELATEVGTAREVVTRRLNALARDGALTIGRGSVTIRDRRMLEDIARGA